jgi:hypothetical protein
MRNPELQAQNAPGGIIDWRRRRPRTHEDVGAFTCQAIGRLPAVKSISDRGELAYLNAPEDGSDSANRILSEAVIESSSWKLDAPHPHDETLFASKRARHAGQVSAVAHAAIASSRPTRVDPALERNEKGTMIATDTGRRLNGENPVLSTVVVS